MSPAGGEERHVSLEISSIHVLNARISAPVKKKHTAENNAVSKQIATKKLRNVKKELKSSLKSIARNDS